MSGMLLKSKGEVEEEAAVSEEQKSEDEDYGADIELNEDAEELDNLLDDNDFQFFKSNKLGFILDDDISLCKQQLSYYDGPTNFRDEKNLFGSLLDLDLDKDDFGSDFAFEDPFQYTREQILEDILKETEEKKEDESKGLKTKVKTCDITN